MKFFEYPIDNQMNDVLCEILHTGLSEIERATGTAVMIFEKFKVKSSAATTNSYYVYYNNLFLMCIKDGPGHTFAVSVSDNSHMTQNMCDIILNCMVNSFKNSYINLTSRTEDEAIELVKDIIVSNSKYFSSDDIAEMSHMLYGEENQQALKDM